MSNEAKFEWRVGWEASTNASFEGYGEWEPFEGDGTTEDEVMNAIESSSGRISEGLAQAIEHSGFGYHVQVRKIEVSS